ncbi:MAG: S-methyl-5-thioribose-1-phosphate isomerase [Pseudonocardia sp.]
MPRTIDWVDGRIEVVDQTRLPELYLRRLSTADELIDAIRRLVVRGAPALGVAGALGVALCAARRLPTDADAGAGGWRMTDADAGAGGWKMTDADAGAGGWHLTDAEARARAARIADARPTAANLAWGVRTALAAWAHGPDAVLAAALRVRDEDIAGCHAIGARGSAWLRERCGPEPLRLLTHCNAGALACVEWGTALGVVRSLHAAGAVEQVYVDETRPLLQGARITALELAHDGIAHRVIVDGAGPSAIARGLVDAVVVGADRIAANGDVANKIGTYPLALAAARAGVPFVVAAPESTVDAATATGTGIEIEDRGADEVLLVTGQRTTPLGSGAWNPAFDVTPADLVSAIVTERRLWRPVRGN